MCFKCTTVIYSLGILLPRPLSKTLDSSIHLPLHSRLKDFCVSIHVMSAVIPIKIMFANTLSVHLTVHKENIRQLKIVCGQPIYAKNGERVAFLVYTESNHQGKPSF